MNDVIARLQRELPDTDRNRYDIAYERGRAQARSGLLIGGLALGSAVGAGLMWLLDPARGAGRRAELASRATDIKNDLAKTAGGKAGDLQNRVDGFAIERGIKDPPTGDSHGHDHPHAPRGADFGVGYREGFGASVADPTAPGSQVADPIKADEILEYGSSGPVAGAAHERDESDADATGKERSASR